MSRFSLPALAVAAAGLVMMRPDVVLRENWRGRADGGDGPATHEMVRPQVTNGFGDGCTTAVQLWLGARTKATCAVHIFMTPIGPDTEREVVRSAQTTPVEDADEPIPASVPAAPWPEMPLGTTDGLCSESVGRSRRLHRPRRRAEVYEVERSAWPAAAVGAIMGLLTGLHTEAVWAFVSVTTGVGLLVTDQHFWRPLCATLSFNYWCAVVWIAWTMSCDIGVALAVVALWMRGSVLLFPPRPGSVCSECGKNVVTIFSCSSVRCKDCQPKKLPPPARDHPAPSARGRGKAKRRKIAVATSAAPTVSTTETTVDELAKTSFSVADGSAAFIDVDLRGKEVLPTGLVDQALEGQVCVLVRRILWRVLLPGILQRESAKPMATKGRLLSGPAGAGKSTVLFMATEVASARGFIVLYVLLGDFLDGQLERVDPCKELVHGFFSYGENSSRLSKLGHNLPPNDGPTDWQEFLAKMLKELRRQKEFPVLIALDQWNSVIGRDDPVSKIFLNPFVSSLKAFTLVAISSSFNPVGKLRDADPISLNLPVSPYDDREWEAVFTIFRKRDQLPGSISSRELKFKTGSVPRLVMFVIKNHRDKKDDPLGAMEMEAQAYYRYRVDKLLKVASTWSDPGDDKPRKNVLEVVSQVVTRGQTGNAISSPLCEVSGLFHVTSTKHGNVWRPICPAVQHALTDALSTPGTIRDTIKCMASDRDTEWRAFELAISMRFAQRTTVALQAIHFVKKSEARPNIWKNELEITTYHRHFQRENFDVGGEKMSLGTAYVCSRGHPVCDILSAESNLVFVQVSQSPYSDHKSRATDLWTTDTVATPPSGGASLDATQGDAAAAADPDGESTGGAASTAAGETEEAASSRSKRRPIPVLKRYAELLPPECIELRDRIRAWHNMKTREHKTFPPQVYYLYITTSASTVDHRRSKRRNEDNLVHLVSKKDTPVEFTKLLAGGLGDFTDLFDKKV